MSTCNSVNSMKGCGSLKPGTQNCSITTGISQTRPTMQQWQRDNLNEQMRGESRVRLQWLRLINRTVKARSHMRGAVLFNQTLVCFLLGAVLLDQMELAMDQKKQNNLRVSKQGGLRLINSNSNSGLSMKTNKKYSFCTNLD